MAVTGETEAPEALPAPAHARTAAQGRRGRALVTAQVTAVRSGLLLTETARGPHEPLPAPPPPLPGAEGRWGALYLGGACPTPIRFHMATSRSVGWGEPQDSRLWPGPRLPPPSLRHPQPRGPPGMTPLGLKSCLRQLLGEAQDSVVTLTPQTLTPCSRQNDGPAASRRIFLRGAHHGLTDRSLTIYVSVSHRGTRLSTKAGGSVRVSHGWTPPPGRRPGVAQAFDGCVSSD